MRRILRRSASIILIFAMLALFSPLFTMVACANATDTLTFKVGYFGWDSSKYVEKKTFTASEIRSLSGSSLRAYTYYDASGHRIAIDSAYGAELDTLLNRAGIDRGSISGLAFYTTDSGNGAFASFTMQELVLTDRYYFPDLAAAITREGTYVDSDAKRELWNNAEKVKVVLAYQDKWVWYPAGTEGAKPTESGMNTANRFRLCFGQSNPLDYRTFQSAKMVETIYVMFQGAPKLSAGDSNITGKIGTKHKLKLTASAADEVLEEGILADARYSSSDESVVRVGQDGTLEYVGKGDATVTVTSGGATVTVKVHVDDKDVKEDEGGSGDGGSGKGSSGSGNGKVDGKGRRPSDSTEIREDDDTQYMYALSDKAGSRLKNALAKTAPAEQASMNTFQEGMDKDAEQLELEEEKDRLIGAVGAIMGIIGIEGALWSYIRFRRSL